MVFFEKISEAPMMFKRKGIYYAVFGACCCYCGNGSEVNVYSSGHVLGPYEKRTSLGQLHSQSTDIFKYIDAGGEEQFMYVGDHWQSSPDGLKGTTSQFGPNFYLAMVLRLLHMVSKMNFK